MSKSTEIGNFAMQLLRQDGPLSSTEYKEYRTKLARALTEAERREKLVRRIAWSSFVVANALMFVGGSRVFGSFDPWSKDATLMSLVLGVIYVLAAIIFPISLASYFSRFRPKVKQLEELLRDTTMLALQGEISELQKQVAMISRRDDLG